MASGDVSDVTMIETNEDTADRDSETSRQTRFYEGQCVLQSFKRTFAKFQSRLMFIIVSYNRFLNVKAVVAAFIQGTALVGAFSVIVQLRRLIV